MLYSKIHQVFPEICVHVLGFVAFVHHHDVKSYLGKVYTFSRDHAEAGDEDAALSPDQLDLLFSVLLPRIIELHDILDLRTPLSQLVLPVGLHGRRCCNQNFLHLARVE